MEGGSLNRNITLTHSKSVRLKIEKGLRKMHFENNHGLLDVRNWKMYKGQRVGNFTRRNNLRGGARLVSWFSKSSELSSKSWIYRFHSAKNLISVWLNRRGGACCDRLRVNYFRGDIWIVQ